MSYARMTEGDVYALCCVDWFGPGLDGYVCYSCPMGDTVAFRTPGELRTHLIEHLERGDVVPERAFAELLEEAQA